MPLKVSHCVKSVRIWSFSGTYSPAFGLNKKRCFLSLCIQSECGKIRTRKTPNTDTFHAVSVFSVFVKLLVSDLRFLYQYTFSRMLTMEFSQIFRVDLVSVFQPLGTCTIRYMLHSYDIRHYMQDFRTLIQVISWTRCRIPQKNKILTTSPCVFKDE